jgi:hypothetical protein
MGEMAKYPLDDRTADRLLSGAMSPEDAPPGFDQVARVVGAVQAPASSGELAREQSVVSLAAAAVSSPVQTSLTPEPHRRKRMVSKLATVRAAAITAAAVLGAGAAAAAATGTLPTETSHASSHASGLLTAGSNMTTTTNGSPNAKPSGSNPLNLPTTGPANFHAVFGLCTAFLAHNSTTSTAGPTTTLPENDSTAFTALRKDAGGGTEASVAATVTWCTNYLKTYSPGNSGSAPNGNGTTPSKPSSPGNSGTHPSGTTSAGSAGTSNSASHGDSSAGTSTANNTSGGASSAGSANAGRR